MRDDSIVRLLGLLINICWYGMGIITGYLVGMKRNAPPEAPGKE